MTIDQRVLDAMTSEARVSRARIDCLIRLAEQTDPEDPHEHAMQAAAFVHSHMDVRQLRDGWAELVSAVHDLERLRAGVTDWTAIDDELVGPGRREAAERIAEDRVQEAAEELVLGGSDGAV